jgi:hypothetical protein
MQPTLRLKTAFHSLKSLLRALLRLSWLNPTATAIQLSPGQFGFTFLTLGVRRFAIETGKSASRVHWCRPAFACQASQSGEDLTILVGQGARK